MKKIVKLSDLVSPPPVDAVFDDGLAEERAADPIKDPADIRAMMEYYRQKGQWRNLVYFVVAISTGLRVSDMLRLRWGSLIDPETMTWRSEIVILERKTANTRKRQRNRHIAISQAVRDVAEEYLGYMDARGIEISLDMYMFRSDRAMRDGDNVPIHRNNVLDFLKKAADAIGLSDKARISCHSTRKTFGYHMMRNNGNSERTLLLLQKMFGHSSAIITLAYIGLTDDEMHRAYLDTDAWFEPEQYDNIIPLAAKTA